MSRKFAGMPLHTSLARHALKNSKFVPRQMLRFNTQSITDVVDFDKLSLLTIQPPEMRHIFLQVILALTLS